MNTLIKNTLKSEFDSSSPFWDVKIIVDKVNFYAHKNILAASCSFFNALFFNGMKETAQIDIILNDCDIEGFHMLLYIIYDNSILNTLRDIGNHVNNIFKKYWNFEIDVFEMDIFNIGKILFIF